MKKFLNDIRVAENAIPLNKQVINTVLIETAENSV